MTSGTDENLNAVLAISPTFALAVGDNGTILSSQLDNNSTSLWSLEAAPSGLEDEHFYGLSSVVEGSDTLIYVVGSNGAIATTTGQDSAFVAMTSNTTANLRSVLAISADSVIAVGDNGTVLVYDGTDWTAVTPFASADFYNISRSSDTLFAAGSAGALYTSVGGGTWTLRTTGSATLFTSVTLNDISQRFFAGQLGGLYRMDYTSFSPYPLNPPVILDDIRGLAATNQYAIGVGQNGLAIQRLGESWAKIVGPTGSVNLNAVAAVKSAPHFAIVVGETGAIFYVVLGPDIPS